MALALLNVLLDADARSFPHADELTFGLFAGVASSLVPDLAAFVAILHVLTILQAEQLLRNTAASDGAYKVRGAFVSKTSFKSHVRVIDYTLS